MAKWKDPIVEEIHRVREQLLADCNNNFDEYMDRLREAQERHPEKLIRKKDSKKAG